MGGDSCSKCSGFESRNRILDGHFSHICCKNCDDICLKWPKINDKRGWGVPIKNFWSTLHKDELGSCISVFIIHKRQEEKNNILVASASTSSYSTWCQFLYDFASFMYKAAAAAAAAAAMSKTLFMSNSKSHRQPLQQNLNFLFFLPFLPSSSLVVVVVVKEQVFHLL